MIIAALLLATVQTVTPAPAVPSAAMTAPVVATPASRLNLDTPVETIVADAAGKMALDAAIPQLTAHPMYETFKGMSLNQLQGYAPDQLSAETMTKVGTALAAVK